MNNIKSKICKSYITWLINKSYKINDFSDHKVRNGYKTVTQFRTSEAGTLNLS